MENYALQQNESILYKSSCSYLTKENENFFESLTTNERAELVLTNQNLIFIMKSKKLFAKEQVFVETYSIDEIKIYKDIPQIKPNDSKVEIFFVSGEKIIDLYSKSEVRKFMNKAFELLTGKTKTVRASDKIKGAVNLVDDTLGISLVGTITNAAQKGLVGTVLGGFIKKPKIKGSKTEQILDAINTTANLRNENSEEQKIEIASLDSQIETLKKLKELLDQGIITQDEFEIKKKQVMGL